MYKKLILGLLILISIGGILYKPASSSFENFVNHDNSQYAENINVAIARDVDFYFKYPPVVQIIFSKIIQIVPTAKNLDSFVLYKQSSYMIYKISLYVAYLLTFISLLLVCSLLKKVKQSEFLTCGIAYFGSVSILLISLGFTHSNIYAIPLFLLSLFFLIKSKHILSSTIFILSVFANWTIIIFTPIFLLTFINTPKRSILSKLIGRLNYFTIPGILIIIFFIFLYFNKSNFIIDNFSSRTLGLYWFINQPLEILSDINSYKKEINIISGFVASLVFISGNIFFGYLLKNLFFKNIKFKFKYLKLLPYLLAFITIIASYCFTDSLFLPFLILFILYFVKLLIAFKKENNYSLKSLINILYLISCSYLLISPSVTQGDLIWIVIFPLISYILFSTKFNKLRLILVNLFIFIYLIVFYGTFANPILTGLYFQSIMCLISGLYILFLTWNITQSFVYRSVN